MGQSQLLDALQVLVAELVAVAADVSALVPQHSAFLVAEGVPDTGPLPVGLPAAWVGHQQVRCDTTSQLKQAAYSEMKLQSRHGCFFRQLDALLWR